MNKIIISIIVIAISFSLTTLLTISNPEQESLPVKVDYMEEELMVKVDTEDNVEKNEWFSDGLKEFEIEVKVTRDSESL